MVAKNWHLPDKGIWEIRNESKHFSFSKLLCWVAVDRAIKIAKLVKQDILLAQWELLRDEIHDDIFKNAWSENKKSFTQAYNSEGLDASLLLMESYGFIEAANPKFIDTVLAIQNELEHKNLMHRYKNKDDFGIPKSSFTICSFWMINGLYRIGHREEAISKFNKLLSFSNHLGLFSEDLDFDTKRQLGNFPQAYSHLALIETAMILSEGEKSVEEEIIDAAC
jgi:GH15 family glucan-1,4-alpha-glucosidase